MNDFANRRGAITQGRKPCAEKDENYLRGFEDGKSYWEPSEFHKNIWREEGAAKEREELIALMRSSFEHIYGRLVFDQTTSDINQNHE